MDISLSKCFKLILAYFCKLNIFLILILTTMEDDLYPLSFKTQTFRGILNDIAHVIRSSLHTNHRFLFLSRCLVLLKKRIGLESVDQKSWQTISKYLRGMSVSSVRVG